MYINTDKERDLFRVIGYLEGIAATMDNGNTRSAIYDALEQLESALAEEPTHD